MVGCGRLFGDSRFGGRAGFPTTAGGGRGFLGGSARLVRLGPRGDDAEDAWSGRTGGVTGDGHDETIVVVGSGLNGLLRAL